MTIYWRHHSALHQIIADGSSDLSFVQDTLEFGDVSPDYSTERNFTLLMAACCKGDKDMVSLFIRHRADLEAKSTYNGLASTAAASELEFSSGVTALVYAVLAEHYDCAKVLIDAGAEDPGLISLNEQFSAYLFYYPLIRGDVKLAKLLVDSYGGNDGILDNGASQFASLINFFCAVRRHWMEGASLKEFHSFDCPFRAYCNAVTYYNSRLYFYKNFTPLSTDEAKSLLDKLSESIDYYISLGIDVNHHERNASGEAWTPLFYAVKYEDPQMTERLLVIGADANHKFLTPCSTPSHLDQNLLHLAVTNYDKDTVEVLLKYGAKVFARADSGEILPSVTSPVLISVSNDLSQTVQCDILRILAKEDPTGVASFRTMTHQRTALTVLVDRLNREEICEEKVQNFKTKFNILLSTCIDLNSADCNGETALHRACQYGNSMVIFMLLRAGAARNFCKLSRCYLSDADPGVFPLTQALEVTNKQAIKSILISFIQNGAELQISHDYHGQIKSTLEMLIYKISICHKEQATLLCWVRLLIIAGYDFGWDLNTLDFLTREESNFESVNKLAREDSRKMKSLLVLCRRNIVKNVQYNYQISVESLLLPTVLKEYLSFKELEDF